MDKLAEQHLARVDGKVDAAAILVVVQRVMRSAEQVGGPLRQARSRQIVLQQVVGDGVDAVAGDDVVGICLPG